MSLRDRLRGWLGRGADGPDERPPRTDAPVAAVAPVAPAPPALGESEAVRALLDALERDAAEAGFVNDLGVHPTGSVILAASGELQVELAVGAMQRSAAKPSATSSDDPWWPVRCALELVVKRLVARKLPWTDVALAALIRALCAKTVYLSHYPLGHVLRAVERRPALAADVDAALATLVARLDQTPWNEREKHIAHVRRLRAGEPAPLQPALVLEGAWMGSVAALDGSAAWRAALEHASAIQGARPTKTWSTDAAAVLGALGADAYRSLFGRALERLYATPRPLEPREGALLAGLVRLAAADGDESTLERLATLAEWCFQKAPNVGARSTKAGNACLATLASMPGDASLAALARVRERVRYPSVRKAVDEAFEAAAQERGTTREELADRVVPTFGMSAVGVLRRALGDCTAELVVESRGTTLRWLRADGKVAKSAPKSVREGHADEVRALKALAKEITKVLGARRAVLERAPLEGRSWRFADWREHVLDHPLTGVLARKLIWRIEDGERTTDVAWADGALVDCDDGAIETPSDDATVQLWHPIEASEGAIVAWRAWLARHAVTQPFKQAHREIYRLTDAERATRIYSNRFAAHVLRQHQLRELCAQRGWSYDVVGQFEGGGLPTLRIASAKLEAEYWIEGDPSANPETSSAGIFLYVGSDQVRFHESGSRAAVLLEEIAPLVFSEVMRDVDLFVGVCSIGNDPSWMDMRERPQYGYWQSVAFGELGATAQTRRDVLAELLPKLAIGARCSLEGRFLRVRGNLRSYRIHLGSGNVLMDPADQYLCIVPDRDAAVDEDVYLPFEGDTQLAVILSKAALLAADDAITDPAIREQIGRA